MMLRRWVLPAGLIALLISSPAHAMTPWTETLMDSTGVYGTWSWVETFSGYGDGARLGTPAYCRCGRTITLRRNGSYEVVVSDAMGPRELSSGRFTIHPGVTGATIGPERFARIWLEFKGTDPEIQPSVRIHFAGRDTIVLFDGADDKDDWKARERRFVRTRESRGTKRYKQLKGLPPNEYGAVPAETDTSYDTPPAPLTRVGAVQGDFARDAGIAGDVLLHVLVQPDGRAAAMTVLNGNPALRGSAMSAVRKWTFQPALKEGMPTQAWTSVLITIPLVPKPVVRSY